MNYDFSTIIDRKGKDAIAVDGLGMIPGKAPEIPKPPFSVIPMWIADMNFATVPSITEAITNRLQHPLFGYFEPRAEYFTCIQHWHALHHECHVPVEAIGYQNGVLGGIVSAITALASPGDAILVHSPTYTGFIHTLRDNGFKIIYSPLVKDEQGIYRMDYQDMEQKIRDHHIRVAIFCSPHNPCGRVWQKAEIESAMEIYTRHHCTVISDEIWSDIVLGDHRHIPTQSVSQEARESTIAFYAPSKTFNVAGLVGSYHIIYNPYLRERVVSKGDKTRYNHMNVLSMYALIGAYQPQGVEWLQQLRAVIQKNMDYACRFITEELDGVTVQQPEGTYMLLIDCQAYLEKHRLDLEILEKRGWDVGVAWQDGQMFQAPTSIRLNMALPYSLVVEAFKRLKTYVFI